MRMAYILSAFAGYAALVQAWAGGAPPAVTYGDSDGGPGDLADGFSIDTGKATGSGVGSGSASGSPTSTGSGSGSVTGSATSSGAGSASGSDSGSSSGSGSGVATSGSGPCDSTTCAA